MLKIILTGYVLALQALLAQTQYFDENIEHINTEMTPKNGRILVDSVTEHPIRFYIDYSSKLFPETKKAFLSN